MKIRLGAPRHPSLAGTLPVAALLPKPGAEVTKEKPWRYMACTPSVHSALIRVYRGMVAADLCAELQQLKRQYESALRVWGQYEFPLHNELVGTRARLIEQLQLKQRALDARNAANGRVLDHKRICPLCAGKAS
jgi:hypothetical protein